MSLFNASCAPAVTLDQFRRSVSCHGQVWTYQSPAGRAVVTFERDGGAGQYRFDHGGRVFRDASLARVEAIAWEQLYVMGH